MNKTMKMFIAAIFALTITLAGVSYADDVTIQLGSGDGFKVQNSSGSPLMDILSSGKVGIGISPNYKLDVSGDINFTGSLYQNGSIYGGAWTTNGSDIYYNSGNVGIGTTSPAAKLEVKDGNIRINSTTGSHPRLRIESSGGGAPDGYWEFWRKADAYGDLHLWDGTNYRLTIKNGNGNVGIGTTSPNYKLHTEVGTNEALWIYGKQGTAIEFHMGFPVNVSDTFYVGTGGFNGSGVPNYGVYMNNIATAWTSNSDKRLKTNIKSLTSKQGLAAIEELDPVTFNWIYPDADKKSQIGLIAQNVQKYFPEIVSRGAPSEYVSEGALGISYTGLIPPIIKAIQELKTEKDEEIVALKAENETLKNTLAALATEISDIKVALRQNNQFGAKLAKAGDLGNIGQ